MSTAPSASGTIISGVAPNAYLGNYKALTIPTPGFGLDGNSAEIAAAIEAAVSDGMNVINLSLGEPEVDPARDIVVHAIEGAAAAGVVPGDRRRQRLHRLRLRLRVVAGQRARRDHGRRTSRHATSIADFSSAGPTPTSLQMKPDVSAPGVNVLSSLPVEPGDLGPAERHEHGDAACRGRAPRC